MRVIKINPYCEVRQTAADPGLAFASIDDCLFKPGASAVKVKIN